jgi:hypothetical protein
MRRGSSWDGSYLSSLWSASRRDEFRRAVTGSSRTVQFALIVELTLPNSVLIDTPAVHRSIGDHDGQTLVLRER